MTDTTQSIPREIFKAYDIRGIVDKGLTEANVEKIGQAIGSEARQRQLPSIAVGRDGRLSGPALAQALINGILKSGVDVVFRQKTGAVVKGILVAVVKSDGYQSHSVILVIFCACRA